MRFILRSGPFSIEGFQPLLGFFPEKADEGELVLETVGWLFLLPPPLDAVLSSTSMLRDLTILDSGGDKIPALELRKDEGGGTPTHCPPEVLTADVGERLAPLTTLATGGRAFLDLLLALAWALDELNEDGAGNDPDRHPYELEEVFNDHQYPCRIPHRYLHIVCRAISTDQA